MIPFFIIPVALMFVPFTGVEAFLDTYVHDLFWKIWHLFLRNYIVFSKTLVLFFPQFSYSLLPLLRSLPDSLKEDGELCFPHRL